MKFLLYMLVVGQVVHAIHESFNFVIPPAKRDCFFENFAVSTPAHKVEVFVAAGGELDIIMTIHGPLSLEAVYANDFEAPIISEPIDAKSESASDTQTFLTTFKPATPGTYAICLDNRHSRMVSKVVQLDVSPKYDTAPVDLQLGADTESDVGAADAEKIRQSLKDLSHIHEGLRTIQMQQQRDRHRLSLHSETNNRNYNVAFLGSIFETAIFIGCAIFQVVFVTRSTPARGKGNWHRAQLGIKLEERMDQLAST